MPLAHFSKVFEVEDAKIAALATDVSGAPTYGSLIDVPGIKRVELTGTLRTVTLRGDFSLLDSDSSLDTLSVAFDYAKLSLDVLAAIVGGSVVDSGSTPNMKSTWAFPGSPSFPYFKLEARTPVNGVDFTGGDMHIVMYKCKISNIPPVGLVEQDYRTFTAQANVSKTISNSKYFDVVFNETTAAIS